MEDDVVNRFSKFRLREEEDGGIEIDYKDVYISLEKCERSLVGKFWGVKTANFFGVGNTFSQLWYPGEALKVTELDYNFFQFIFTKSEEKDRAMLRRPWFFKNQLLLLQRWKPNMKSDDDCFRMAPMWIQIRKVPTHWSSKDVGWKIGKLFKSCSNVIVSETGSKNGRVMKLLVDIDLGKPLLRGTKIKLETKTVWVDFRYEQLPTFCFYCRKVGHQERLCEEKCRIHNTLL